jgi:hypothetical protein
MYILLIFLVRIVIPSKHAVSWSKVYKEDPAKEPIAASNNLVSVTIAFVENCPKQVKYIMT